MLTGICNGYSVLSHEEIVDLLWLDQIRPLLLNRFPGTTTEDLRKAHAYAYGGCMVQDMGYYPFGNKYFSDLVHYVRSGDFVENLVEESSNVNEYAFALGALAHYAADTMGHPTVNQIVGMEFPELRKKYGNAITYAQNPKAHIQAEFGLDVEQIAKGRFSSDAYHDFIGFEVSKPLLERAFLKTYGLELSDVFKDIDLSIGTFRRSISKIIPKMTKAALIAHEKELVKETPNFDRKKFQYYLSRAQYEREWGNKYQKPGFGTRVLAFFLKFVPKIGPFKALAFKIPSPKAEDRYIKSVNETVEEYRRTLRQAAGGRLNLPNLDFDTGKPTRPGEYVLTDKAYARLVHELAEKKFAKVTPDLRANILEFFHDSKAPAELRKDQKEWERTVAELDGLKSYVPRTVETPASPGGSSVGNSLLEVVPPAPQ
jgi:Zinc dependent phospholipase C